MNTCPVYRRSGGHSYGGPSPAPSARCWPRAATRRRTHPCPSPRACAARAPTSARSRSRCTTSSWRGGASWWPPRRADSSRSASPCAWRGWCSRSRALYELAGRAARLFLRRGAALAPVRTVERLGAPARASAGAAADLPRRLAQPGGRPWLAGTTSSRRSRRGAPPDEPLPAERLTGAVPLRRPAGAARGRGPRGGRRAAVRDAAPGRLAARGGGAGGPGAREPGRVRGPGGGRRHGAPRRGGGPAPAGGRAAGRPPRRVRRRRDRRRLAAARPRCGTAASSSSPSTWRWWSGRTRS